MGWEKTEAKMKEKTELEYNKERVTEHYYKEETAIPLQLGLLSGFIKGQEFEFFTSPPVFSWRRIDNGTRTLAEGMHIKETDKTLLDMGCGFGILGVVAAQLNPNLKVTMVDMSYRAILLAVKNIKKYRLGNRAEAIQGNLYEKLFTKPAELQLPKPIKFDIIVSNPPYSAGRKIVDKIIEQAPLHLNNGGSLQIVGRKAKGGEMYKQKMIDVFENCEEFGIQSGFRVYKSNKIDKDTDKKG